MKTVSFLSDTTGRNQEDIRIIVTGDFYPGGVIEECCEHKEYEKIFNDVLPVLKDKDISITNLECPLIENVRPISKTGMNLYAGPGVIEALRYGMFDAVTLANNHIFDQGADGIRSTLDIFRQNNIKTVGIGENLKAACTPLYLEVKGKRIAVLNVAEQEFSIAAENRPGAAPLDTVLNYYQIREIKKHSDIQLVVIHGGYQYHPLPSPDMMKTYRFFADLGVTAIIGHHAHCASGYEYYHGVPIFYNLGNFIFDLGKRKSPLWYQGYFIKLIIAGDKVKQAQLYPYFQNKGFTGVRLMSQEEEKEYWRNIDSYCETISDPQKIEQEWKKVCQNVRKGYLLSLMNAPWIFRKLNRRKLLPEIFVRRNKKFWLPYLNTLRCPSHREAAITILREETGAQ
ncbi:MAG: CapA family protein [Candidatus Omnitrophica bacterium]|nr:CapA family protein [Candidatus Omnitrophota bacterium]